MAATIPPTLLAVQEGAAGGALGTMEIVFLVLFALFTPLYWRSYPRIESLGSSAGKVAGLLLFVYLVISLFDWLAQEVPPEEVVTFWGLLPAPTAASSRVPGMEQAFLWLIVAIVALVVWHARRKFSTVGGVVLSAWDRGHWYMLPVIFVLMTVGLLLVAAAASPVLSPFIYTLF